MSRLLIAKLNAYGFDRNVLKLVYDYFSNRMQKTKGGFSFSVIIYVVFFLYQHLHIKQKNLQSPGIHIYVVIYLETKNVHIKYKKIKKQYNLKIIKKSKE